MPIKEKHESPDLLMKLDGKSRLCDDLVTNNKAKIPSTELVELKIDEVRGHEDASFHVMRATRSRYLPNI